MIKQIVVDFFIVVVEGSEDVLVVHAVNDPACLPDRVHAQHCAPDIDALDPGPRSQDWPDRRPTRRVILDNHFLHGHIGLLGQDLED